MTDLERAPILRVMPGPGDINANGHIFGGWVLSQMDIAAGIVASRRAQGAGRDGRDRGDEVHRADPPARPDLGLCRGRAGRPHVDGRADRGRSPTATSARPRSRSPKACSPSSRSMPSTGRGRSISRSGLGGRRDLVVASAGRGRASRRRGAARLSSSGSADVRIVGADRRRKHVERKAVVAAVHARARDARRRSAARSSSVEAARLALAAVWRSTRSLRSWRSPRSWTVARRSSRSALRRPRPARRRSSPSSSSMSSSRWRRGSAPRSGRGFRPARGNNGPRTADNIRSGRGRPRAARRAPCSCIFRAAGRHCRAGDCPAGCPAVRRGSGPRCPPRPRRRPPCRLLIKCLRPYAVVASPFGLRRSRAAQSGAGS